MQSQTLITENLQQVENLIAQSKVLLQAPLEYLNWRPAPDSWSILECIEHLALYNDYYNPEITKALKNSNTQAETEFRPGLLGNYFASSMLPKPRLNKMKTFKDKNPIHQVLTRQSLERFIKQQKELLSLLEASRTHSLNKIKISISIARYIRIKLGDTYRFIINHQIRHFAQLDRVRAAYEAQH